ncbi:dTDP-4-dehydrorhamnose 3,5-epimerase [Alphaproteobacteria bacterium]|nr:dTDP-4-dehydrorhamnose 3,5-epimerase [Alphaproteobacteria bacterium]
MGTVGVNQILITPLGRIRASGGDVLHGMKCSDPGYVDFGEAYFSIVEPGAVKAWKRHLRMTLNIVVPSGAILFAFLDERGEIRQEVVEESRYVRLTVPPGIWFGFKGLLSTCSILMNIADIPHDPDEIERKALNEFKYNWNVK